MFDGLAMVLFTTALDSHAAGRAVRDQSRVAADHHGRRRRVLLAEEVGWRRWTAIVVGFLGTLLMIKPTPGAFNAWALLGVATAFAGVARDMITRQLDPRIPSIMISFLAAFGSMIIGPIMGLFEEWRPMALFDVGMLAISATFVASGHFLVVVAFRGGVDVAAIAPFRYTLLIFAGVCGYLAFGEVPDRFAIAGSLLIVGSGLYALHREVVRRRAVAAPWRRGTGSLSGSGGRVDPGHAQKFARLEHRGSNRTPNEPPRDPRDLAFAGRRPAT